MKRQLKGALGTLLAVGIALAVSVPAAAQTSGKETFNGAIVTSGASGARVVKGSVIVGQGVFNGVGRVVEIQNRPGDPSNVSRDNLVFADGRIEIVTTTLHFSLSLNRRSCIGSARVKQRTRIVGGSGRFAHASGTFAGTVTGRALFRRNRDGGCSQKQEPLFEVDIITSSGSLSF